MQSSAPCERLERVFLYSFGGMKAVAPKGWLVGWDDWVLPGPWWLKWKCCCERKLDDLPRSWLPPLMEMLHKTISTFEQFPMLGRTTRDIVFSHGTCCLEFLATCMVANQIWFGHIWTKAAEDLTSLFNVGIVVDGQRWFAALVGSKGDLKFQATVVAVMNRSFQNMGSVRQIACCSLCLAGTESYPMEDVAHEAGWVEFCIRNGPGTRTWATIFPSSFWRWETRAPLQTWRLPRF